MSLSPVFVQWSGIHVVWSAFLKWQRNHAEIFPFFAMQEVALSEALGIVCSQQCIDVVYIKIVSAQKAKLCIKDRKSVV